MMIADERFSFDVLRRRLLPDSGTAYLKEARGDQRRAGARERAHAFGDARAHIRNVKRDKGAGQRRAGREIGHTELDGLRGEARKVGGRAGLRRCGRCGCDRDHGRIL